MINNNPICDSDLIVKLCKCKKKNDLFKIYEKVYFSDAVCQEIKSNMVSKKKKNRDLISAFIEANNSINENIKTRNASIINLYEQDEEKIKVIKKHLRNENIIYDDNQKEYMLDNNIGEKVSIIYAAILGIKIILSDDNGSKDFAKKFLRLNVIRLNEVLHKIGLSGEDIQINNFIANNEYSEVAYNAMKEYKKTGSVKTMNYVGILLDYRRKYKRH